MCAKFFTIFVGVLISIQTSAYQFHSISTEEGLDHPFVREVIQSSDGLMWVATLKGLNRFDGYEVKNLRGVGFDQLKKVTAMAAVKDSSDVVVGTAGSGVYITNGTHLTVPDWRLTEPESGVNEMLTIEQQIWLIYPNDIFIMESQVIKHRIDNPLSNKTTSALYDATGGMVWLAGKDQVFKIDLDNFNAVEIVVSSTIENRRIMTLEIDQEGKVWLGRSDGLYLFNLNCQCFESAPEVFSKHEIYDLVVIGHQLWIGTPLNGVYMYDFNSRITKHFKKGALASGQLSDNSILKLFAGHNDMLWIGTFNAGFSFIDTKVMRLGQLSNQTETLACSPDGMVFDVFEQSKDSVWLATGRGLVNFSERTKMCELYELAGSGSATGQNHFIYSIHAVNEALFWLSTSQGVFSFNVETKETRPLAHPEEQHSSYFIAAYQNNQYFIGSANGLYIKDGQGELKIVNLAVNETTQAPVIDSHAKTSLGDFWFGARPGLLQLIDEQLVPRVIHTAAGDEIKYVTGLASDGQGGLLIASEEVVLMRIDESGHSTDLSGLFKQLDLQPIIYEMVEVDGWFWLSSDSGIFKLNLSSSELIHFGTEDGSIAGGFVKNASHLGASGRLYFGGKQGLLAFKPEELIHSSPAPAVIMTGLMQLNKELTEGDQLMGGHELTGDINDLQSLALNHKDIALGFEFAALDYASPQHNQYAYRLTGFNDTWSTTTADNRRAVYTNLKPGNYSFEVKAANKDGVWNEQLKVIDIAVAPAPWLSPWAFALYGFSLLLAIITLIRHRTASARKRATHLEVVVNERTQELKTQKQMVESLLNHKNELFANVTHEFKTPLALIKGPTDLLLADDALYPYRKKLQMIKRNANRLLVMVGQILKLSEIEQEKVVVREYQAVQPVLHMLSEAYQLLAGEKRIVLHVENISTANIYATADFLEMVVGNLLSNAIKFTAVGGEVLLRSEDLGEQVIITVQDSGTGISEKDQAVIFERFTRLKSHRNIQGTGIGLAVVKEITQANGGQVSVESAIGKGSTFIVQLPKAQWQHGDCHQSDALEQQIENTANELQEDVLPTDVKHKNAAVKLLVIEDNLDMRSHIGEILGNKYQCMFADRGSKGIAIALKSVPDIVICDVMMPEMDGFQVTRILRNDGKTSHIPIILLTALNTKESRIKGWRENIDVYLTKPFDATELHATLSAVLNVRKILQQKTQDSLSATGTTDALDLPKQDLKFVNKMKQVIAGNYHDSMFMRPQLASEMAVSERQLQRKVKGLIDDSPMNLLRNYRLEMAAQKLTEGFQVSLVGDECGFSSVSYFAACFKKKYGMTPKKYQMAVNKKS